MSEDDRKRNVSKNRRPTVASTLEVLHRCKAYVAIDKPPDMRMDSGRNAEHAGDPNVMDLLRGLVGAEARDKVRPCHQLDYATSGVLMYALSKKAAARASALFEQRKTRKKYSALVWGHVPASTLVCEEPICKDPADDFRMMCGDKDVHWALPPAAVLDVEALAALKQNRRHSGDALTRLAVVQRGTYLGQAVTKVELTPHTGRRHQLRVHCAHLGFPIVGDATYSPDAETSRMMLHAHALHLPFEPTTHKAQKIRPAKFQDRPEQHRPDQAIRDEPLDIVAPDPFLPGQLPDLVLQLPRDDDGVASERRILRLAAAAGAERKRPPPDPESS